MLVVLFVHSRLHRPDYVPEKRRGGGKNKYRFMSAEALCDSLVVRMMREMSVVMDGQAHQITPLFLGHPFAAGFERINEVVVLLMDACDLLGAFDTKSYAADH